MKHLAKELFGSGHALNSPAHLTLIPPFFATDDEIKSIADALQEILKQFDVFNLELSGFDTFGNRVIFVDVKKNDKLFELQQAVFNAFIQAYPSYKKPNRFHPHFTIAFKDLEKEVFSEAWDYFSSMEYEAGFDVNEISILRHKDKKWHITEKLKTGKA
jgi:2'-5' RNA ligase